MMSPMPNSIANAKPCHSNIAKAVLSALRFPLSQKVGKLIRAILGAGLPQPMPKLPGASGLTREACAIISENGVSPPEIAQPFSDGRPQGKKKKKRKKWRVFVAAPAQTRFAGPTAQREKCLH